MAEQQKGLVFRRAKPATSRSSIGTAIGVVALALGVGAISAYMLDMHAHTCEACGNRWRHLGAFNLGDPDSHTCVKCGTVQWWKDGVPHVFRNALRTVPPSVCATRARLQALVEAHRLTEESHG